MFGLIGLGIAAAVGIYAHKKSRSFVRRRLRYTSWVEKRWLGIIAGALTAVALSWLPVVTIGAGLLVGAGVGSGVSMGASDVRNRRLIDE
ncbi:MAG: hypothetical protein F4179_00055 [Gammaproteobacteria bacterium]|nr:hypothetical protein [Gammaproteobacteria bacterium]MXY31383.1 hypothetical protein [Gammaproteobacteria bacterium]MYC99627.1 hypothetical protein [Gammaproteobacteria bacterium]MYF60063.1 hypothetical protein [Gammaproteobacteria bacterium]MYI23537.1 hypothetical protein [Gammaproteobacteria bacterium]